MQGDLDEICRLETVLADGRLIGGSFFSKNVSKQNEKNMKIRDETNDICSDLRFDRCIRRGLAGSIGGEHRNWPKS